MKKILVVMVVALLVSGVVSAAEPEATELVAYPNQTDCKHYMGTLSISPPVFTETKLFEVLKLNGQLQLMGTWSHTTKLTSVVWEVDTTEVLWLQGRVTGEGWTTESPLVPVDCPRPTPTPEATPTPFTVYLPLIWR